VPERAVICAFGDESTQRASIGFHAFSEDFQRNGLFPPLARDALEIERHRESGVVMTKTIARRSRRG
jgi:hypothetical protein